MSPEAQRIAIAKACPKIAYIDQYGKARWNRKGSHNQPLFDPISDLNTMHEAKKALTKEQKERYAVELFCIVANTPRHKRNFPISAWMTFFVLSATASQHAEAFLKTLNLWTPSEQGSGILASQIPADKTEEEMKREYETWALKQTAGMTKENHL